MEGSTTSEVEYIEAARARVLAGAESAPVFMVRDEQKLEQRLSLIGLGRESTKMMVYGLKLADWEHKTWESMQFREFGPGRSVTSIMSGIGDINAGLEDYPNDFTIALIFRLPDGVHVAIRNVQEDCELIPPGYDEHNMPDDREREFELVQKFEVSFCPLPEPPNEGLITEIFER